METQQIRDCLLNDRHFFEEVIPSKRKRGKVTPLFLTLLTFTTPLTAALILPSSPLTLGTSEGIDSITFDGTISPTICLVGSNSYSVPINFAHPGVITSAAGTMNTLSGPLTGSGSFTFAGASSTSDLIFSNNVTTGFTGPFNLTGGTVTVSGTNPLGTGPIKIEGSHTTGGVIDFGAKTSLSNNIHLVSHPANTSVFEVTTETTTTLTGQVSGSDVLIYSGPGTLYLHPTTSNTYSGGTTFTGGKLEGSGTNPFGSGTVTYESGAGGITLTGTGSYANPFAFVIAPTFTLNNSASTFTTTALLSGSGPVTLIGTGYLNLAGPDASYTGGFQLNSGTLGLGTANSAGTGTIAFNGGKLSLNGITGVTNPLSVSSSGGFITLNSETTNSFVSPSSIIGSGLLTFERGSEAFATNTTSTLNISGQNNSSFLGSFAVNSGVILEVTSTDNLNSRPITFDGGQLTFLGSDTFASPILLSSGGGTFSATGTNTLSGNITNFSTGAGSLTFSGSGTWVISGSDNTYSGGTTLAGGILQTAGNHPLGFGPVTFNGGNLILFGPTSLSNPLSFPQAATLTVGSMATLSGPIGGLQGFVLNGGGTLAITSSDNTGFSGSVMLTSGTLQTSGTTPLGTGALVLTPGALLELTGSTTLPNNILLMPSATIHIDSGTTTLNGNISGFNNTSSLTKMGGGTLVIDGVGTYGGRTTLSQGSMILNGSLTGATTVNVGTVLSGTGKIQAPLTVDGTVSPGSGAAPFLSGTLTAGSTTFNPGSFFEVLANGSQSGLLNSTGDITLSPLATLIPHFNPTIAQSYVVIQSAGTITGQFAPYSFKADRFNVNILYFPQQVVLNVQFTPFATLLPKGNLQNIGACLDSAPASTPGLTTLLSTFNSLTASETVSAFYQLDPSFYNVLAFAEEAVSEKVRNTYTQHTFERIYDPEFLNDSYMAFFGQKIHQDSFQEVPSLSGYDDIFSGFVIGFDRFLSPDLIASTGFSYARSRVDWSHASAKSTINSYTGYLGATWLTPTLILDAYGSYTRHQAQGSRSIFIPHNSTTFPVSLTGPGINLKPTFKGASECYTTHIGAISKQQINDSSFYLLAYVDVDYLWVNQHPLTEKNGSALALNLYSKRSDLLRPESGVGFGGSGILFNGENLFFELDIGYLGMFRFQGQKTEASFVNNDCVFLVSGLKPSHNLIRPSLRFGISSTLGVDVAFNYSGAFGNRYSENEGKIELTYLF